MAAKRHAPSISATSCGRKAMLTYVFNFHHGVSYQCPIVAEWLGSRVVSVLDSGAESLGSNRSRNAVG